MRILVCAAEAPLPPLNGFRLQTIPVSARLAERGHEVCVLAYRREGQVGEPPPGVELISLDYPDGDRLWTAVRWASRREPLGVLTAERRISEAARRLIESREFDVAHVAGWSLAGMRPALAPLPAILTIFDAWHLNYAARRDSAPLPLKPVYEREVRRIARFEAENYSSFSSVVVVSDEDAAALKELNPDIPAISVPNGVDTERFAPGDEEARDPNLVVMTGAMHWAPNVAAARFLVERILPRLRERIPAVRVAIVGRDPAADVRHLARTDGVEVTGEVPDLGGWLRQAGAYACPMVNGTGIKNKLLEAMASGCPCVATPIACQGLEVEDGRHLMVAAEPDAFAGALADVLTDRATAARLGADARALVTAEHDWDSVASTYERLLAGAR